MNDLDVVTHKAQCEVVVKVVGLVGGSLAIGVRRVDLHLVLRFVEGSRRSPDRANHILDSIAEENVGRMDVRVRARVAAATSSI